jgi:hypothetical protein
MMRWGIVLPLALHGAVIGLLSVLGVTGALEPAYWGVAGVFCAGVVAWAAPGRWFAHGFAVGLGGYLAPILQAALFSTYLAHNPAYADEFARAPLAPRAWVLVFGAIVVLVWATVLGALSWIGGRLLRRRRTAPA